MYTHYWTVQHNAAQHSTAIRSMFDVVRYRNPAAPSSCPVLFLSNPGPNCLPQPSKYPEHLKGMMRMHPAYTTTTFEQKTWANSGRRNIKLNTLSQHRADLRQVHNQETPTDAARPRTETSAWRHNCAWSGVRCTSDEVHHTMSSSSYHVHSVGSVLRTEERLVGWGVRPAARRKTRSSRAPLDLDPSDRLIQGLPAPGAFTTAPCSLRAALCSALHLASCHT